MTDTTIAVRKLRVADEDPDLSYLGRFVRASARVDAIAHGHPYCQHCGDTLELHRDPATNEGGWWAHEDTGEGFCTPDPALIGYAVGCLLSGYDDGWELCDDPTEAQPTPIRGSYECFEPGSDYGAADYERMVAYVNGRWSCVGVVVEATLTRPDGFTKTLDASLWGIESDSGDDYFEEVAGENWAEIRDQVIEHVSAPAADAAFAAAEWEKKPR